MTRSRSDLRRVLAEIFWEYEHHYRDDQSQRERLAAATERDVARRQIEDEAEEG